MTKNNFKGSLFLFLAALIWGSAFVSQSAGMKYVGPYTFNLTRSFVGFLTLIPLTLLFRKSSTKAEPLTPSEEKALNRRSAFAGVICGLLLSAATSFQQVGISMTTAGKAGFITALYIIIVPILGIVFKRKVPRIIWFCAAIALTGFYFLSVGSDFTLSKGDLLCLISAFCFSVQIMAIDHFVKHEKKVDPVMISMVQFLTVTVVSVFLTLFLEKPSLSGILSAAFPILYCGIMSSGIAYTLQILGQKNCNPAVAPLIMSLESVFAAFFGWMILGESMSLREIFGCALVLSAVILSQLPSTKTPH